jgi:hypothetical protein
VSLLSRDAMRHHESAPLQIDVIGVRHSKTELSTRATILSA